VKLEVVFGIGYGWKGATKCRAAKKLWVSQPNGVATEIRSDLGDWGAVNGGDDWEARLGTSILYTPARRRQGFCREKAVIR
jgi:hypothetical protein